ncbi:neutral/alkaline non-lysosomal ceramidase C-terminal domain-containing protein [Nocardia sp. NPDC002869]|uniref:neutral/alkaline non-lysosomal ceramidase C-terminal domain-containing protein n=1 Tax=Nocardia sp. NPDC002869 TaxID=3161032 RepID=UPI00398C993C
MRISLAKGTKATATAKIPSSSAADPAPLRAGGESSGSGAISASLDFTRPATALVAGAAVDRGPAPRDLSHLQPDFVPAPGPDTALPGHDFGATLTPPAAHYTRGTRAEVEFASAHPKHNPRRNGTFLEVQRLVDGRWVRVANEGEWAVRFHWSTRGPGTSVASFTWDIPADAAPGCHRFVHFADRLTPGGRLEPIVGTSTEFDIA